MPHPDFAVPPAGYYDHGLNSPLKVERARRYAKALDLLKRPADRPTETSGGCNANLQTAGPAGSVVVSE